MSSSAAAERLALDDVPESQTRPIAEARRDELVEGALEQYREADLAPRETKALGAWFTTFYPYQADWLFSRARRAICNKSRQIGYSHVTAALGVIWAAFHGEVTTIISKGQPESDEVLDKARKHAAVLTRLGSAMAKPSGKDNTQEIEFPSGGRIISLPSSGGRGFTGNCILDEYAYQQHDAQVWDAAAAVTLLGFRLRVISTPNGRENDFAEVWKNAPGFERFLIPLAIAREQGYPVDLDDAWALAKGDPRIFDQLFRCQFLDSDMQYLPDELIADPRVMVDDLRHASGDYYAGLDVGRNVNISVLYVLRRAPGTGVFTLAHVEWCKRTEYDKLESMVGRAFQRFKPLRRLSIDSTGLGTFPAQLLQKKFGEKYPPKNQRPRVEAIDFTINSKEELATGLYTVLSEHKLRIPKTDAALKGCPPGTAVQLRADLRSIRREVTKAGNVRYDAAQTSSGAHADHAWALALAVFAGSSVNPMLDALQAATAVKQ